MPIKIEHEFSGANFGDARLDARIVAIATRIAEEPSRPFPQAMTTEKETEGFYRFMNNANVNPAEILEPHVRETVARAGLEEAVLCIHDSTEVYPASADEGGGFFKMSNGWGYLAHVSLCVSARGFTPMGVLKLSIPEIKKRDPNVSWREVWASDDKLSSRWLEHAIAAEELVPDVPMIHVMDREADSYEILHDLCSRDSLFVIRLSYDRRISGGEVVSDALPRAQFKSTRIVPLGGRKPRRGKGKRRRPAAERRHPSRNARKAKLELRVLPDVNVLKPKDLPRTMEAQLPLSVVHVVEPKPPKGEKAVDWIIITNLPVETQEDVELVVDIYRRRWLIEELFLCLKTGCGLNHRQPESLRSAGNGFALLSVFAWQLLLLRQMERTAPKAKATDVLSKEAIHVLRRILPRNEKFPTNPRVHHLLKGFARLGGHQTSNGPPGWRVLSRGYFTFLRALNDDPWIAWLAA